MTDQNFAEIKFEPCDREKYPCVPQPVFMAGMERVGRIAYSAHVLAYFTKSQLQQLQRGFEGPSGVGDLLSDLRESRETFAELCRTIEAVELRIAVTSVEASHAA
jgi:hypothetical protein